MTARGVETDCGEFDIELRRAASLLANASDVTLFGHVDPDADALGSALALGTALHHRGAAVRVSFGRPDVLSDSLSGLDANGLVVPSHRVPASVPLLVVLDTGDAHRLGGLEDRVAATIQAGGDVLVVDHHVANTRFGTQHVIDPSAEATVLLVLRLLDELGIEPDRSIARCLYAGLVTDTRSFRHASASAHRVAARLLGHDIDAEELVRSLMDTHPFRWMAALSDVLHRAELDPDAARGFGLAHTTVRLCDVDGMSAHEADSVVEVLRTAGEAEVTAVLKELGEQRWSVSLRSEGRLDVGAAARALGGGGHDKASGFTTEAATSADVVAALRAALTDVPTL
ncbi:DHH family phosphoesterase [Allosaccharopolyspora coralli]|uniref:DHH family phosphoesterase n=1 Tax=Allosaccharopolyspora coralli TaxID=2665642 RepID=UPI001E500AE0|nr:DHH family phosphoesterase [Allosaccharopolyspora coralli]